MRTTLNISLPDDLYLFIRDQVEAGAYASISEYVRALVREDYSRSDVSKRNRPRTSGPRRVNDIMRDEY